jgi:ubiquitin C-terminal hydrolase
MNIIEKMNSSFKQGQEGDLKDFIIFILEQLHKELKRPIDNNGLDNKLVLNQYDKDNAFNYFFNEFKKECSIISDVFFGFTETTNECLNCNSNNNSKNNNNLIYYKYNIFNCLIFPLEEFNKMKKNENKNNNIEINSNCISIYECFYYNQKTELFSGENKCYCNKCKQLTDSNTTTKIFISPNYLIIILNRGKGNIYDVKLDFTETIDITQFVLKKEKPQIKYNLYGVITHIEQSGTNAYFIASCKNPIDNKWYRFNDSIVKPITNIQKEIIEFCTPYILFYQKNNI